MLFPEDHSITDLTYDADCSFLASPLWYKHINRFLPVPVNCSLFVLTVHTCSWFASAILGLSVLDNQGVKFY